MVLKKFVNIKSKRKMVSGLNMLHECRLPYSVLLQCSSLFLVRTSSDYVQQCPTQRCFSEKVKGQLTQMGWLYAYK